MMKENQSEEKIELCAMNGTRCRMLVVLMVILFCMAIFAGLFLATGKASPIGFLFRDYENSVAQHHYLSYKFPIAFLGSLGVIVFLISAFASGLFAKTYTILFKKTEIVISSKGEQLSISYQSLTACFIVKDTDYSRVVWTMDDGKKYTLFIGLCHMLSPNKQQILASDYVLDPFFPGFLKEIGGRRGKNTITYRRKKQPI